MNKTSNLFLGEHSWKSLGFTDFWKNKSLRFFKPHDLVVVFQPEHSMFEMRNTVSIPVQEHRQIAVNVSLGKIVRKFLEIQYRLRNLQAIRVDRTIRILCKAEFLSKKRNTLPEFGNSFNRPVQVCIGHGVLWCRELMTEGLRGLRHLPAPLEKRK